MEGEGGQKRGKGREGGQERGAGGEEEEEEERVVPRFTACGGVVKRWTCAVAAL